MLCKTAAFICLCFAWLFSSPCYSQGVTADNKTSLKIDSLIEVQKINKKCILIKFGADAVTAINTNKGIVVVDAGISTGLTARYRKIIENEFHKNNFAYVINSHGHHDHNGGNSIFPEAGIIGQVNCLQEISGERKNPEKVIKSLAKTVEEYQLKLQSSEPAAEEWKYNYTQKTRYLNAYYDAKSLIPVKKPGITFSDSINLDLGNFSAEILYFGKCHSSSDILIYLPGMKILFTGDLFTKYGRPNITYNPAPDKNRRRQAVQWIEKRMANIETIINGHGEMLSVDDLKYFNKNIVLN